MRRRSDAWPIMAQREVVHAACLPLIDFL